MSADRRWDQRRFRLEESTTQNSGARTMFIEHMTPGTTVPPHFHTRFSETFDLISGEMTVYASAQPHNENADLQALEQSANPLVIGERVSVEPGVYHKYLVGDTSRETILRVIVTPGDSDFERLLKILNGLGETGELQDLGNDPVLGAVVMNLSDAHLIGPAAVMLEEVKKEKGQEVHELREKLLQRFDNDESLGKLLKM